MIKNQLVGNEQKINIVGKEDYLLVKVKVGNSNKELIIAHNEDEDKIETLVVLIYDEKENDFVDSFLLINFMYANNVNYGDFRKISIKRRLLGGKKERQP